MAGQPTYDPGVWVGGIILEGAGPAVLREGRHTAAVPRHPGPVRPRLDLEAVHDRRRAVARLHHDTRLNCSSAFQVGNRAFKNYESGAYGYIGFDKALQVSCNTFFYRVGYGFWAGWAPTSTTCTRRTRSSAPRRCSASARRPGSTSPARRRGRIADRKWKLAYWKANKDYYCKLGEKPGYDFLHRFAREFCLEGFAYRAGDAVNFAIGQGDTIVTPLQLARGYAAISNGGTLWEPRVAKAIVDPHGNVVKRIKPKKSSKVKVSAADLRYIDTALQGTSRVGTMAWRLVDFPLDTVKIRSKTGSAEVYGKQSTSWVASYDKRYVVVMMVSQGGTGSGTSGPAVRKIWETLYGIDGTKVDTDAAALPGAKPPVGLPVFARDGAILPPMARAAERSREPRKASR